MACIQSRKYGNIAYVRNSECFWVTIQYVNFVKYLTCTEITLFKDDPYLSEVNPTLWYRVNSSSITLFDHLFDLVLSCYTGLIY